MRKKKIRLRGKVRDLQNTAANETISSAKCKEGANSRDRGSATEQNEALCTVALRPVT